MKPTVDFRKLYLDQLQFAGSWQRVEVSMSKAGQAGRKGMRGSSCIYTNQPATLWPHPFPLLVAAEVRLVIEVSTVREAFTNREALTCAHSGAFRPPALAPGATEQNTLFTYNARI